MTTKTWTVETMPHVKRTVIGQGPDDHHYAFTTEGSGNAEDAVNMFFGTIMEQGEWEKGSEAWAEVQDAPEFLLGMAATELRAGTEQVWFFKVWRNEFDSEAE